MKVSKQAGREKNEPQFLTSSEPLHPIYGKDIDMLSGNDLVEYNIKRKRIRRQDTLEGCPEMNAIHQRKESIGHQDEANAKLILIFI
jgi:hypothetical protein